MIAFLWKKIWKNKWIFLCLLMGNILLAGVAAGVPMYARASMQRMLARQAREAMQQLEAYPGLLSFNAKLGASGELDAKSSFLKNRNQFMREVKEWFGVEALSQRESITLEGIAVEPAVKLYASGNTFMTELTAMTGFEEHAKIIKGRMYSNEIGADGVLEVVCSARTYDAQKIMMDTVYTSTRFKWEDDYIAFRVVGVFENSLETDPYWTVAPAAMQNVFFYSHDLAYDRFVENDERGYMLTAEWNTVLDCAQLDAREVERYSEILQDCVRLNRTLKENLSVVFEGFGEKAAKLDVTLWVLQVPAFVLLAFFIYMVNGRILELDRSDISVLKSRGATRGAIVKLYVWQGLIVSAISIVAGLGMGVLLCRMIGASNGFLNFVSRAGLDVRVDLASVLFVLAALAVSMLMMLVPVAKYSRVDIVELRRDSGKKARPIWQTLFLDVLALAVSGYGLYTFRQGITAPESVAGAQAVDPLMFMASSLFIVGAGLVCLRVYPLVIELLFRLLRRVAPPSLYASLLSVRRGGGERFIMIFLMFTLAAGIFYARMALTITRNTEDRLHYTTAADMRVRERWMDNAIIGEMGVISPATMYYEPDYSKYTTFPEVEMATKVVMERARVSVKSEVLPDVQLMGIHTDEFGRVAWFREDLLPIHINYYLNALVKDPRGVLLSADMKAYCEIGDTVRYQVQRENGMGTMTVLGEGTGVVYGFVDYWPGYVPGAANGPRGLVVANLNYLQANWGVTPYEVWLRTNAETGNFLTSYANEKRIRFVTYTDAKDMLTKLRNDPVVQGTNGAMTVNFIITLLLCGVGFLIYWVLSMKSRALQFGVFRAMGLSMRGVFAMLVHEQVLVSGVAIALGITIGEVASRLFVPIIQVAYAASEDVIPLQVAAGAADYGQMLILVGVMMVVCISILGGIISKIRIAAALKLGED